MLTTFFHSLLQIRRKLNLRLHHVIAIIAFAAVVIFCFVLFLVYRRAGPLSTLFIGVATPLLVYRRLMNWPGLGTPKIEMQPKLLYMPSLSQDAVRIVCMSDTHVELTKAIADEIPHGDIFIYCGDESISGTKKETEAFNTFLGHLSHKIKVWIPGNHSICCDRESYEKNFERMAEYEKLLHPKEDREFFTKMSTAESLKYLRETLMSNATHVLINEIATIDVPAKKCSVKFCGVPVCDPIDGACMAAFSLPTAEQNQIYAKLWQQHKAKSTSSKERFCDILMTHTPPRCKTSFLDQTFFGMHVGSEALSAFLLKLDKDKCAPLYNCSGHIHEARGATKLTRSDLGDESAHASKQELETTFINASSVNLRYELRPRPLGACVVFDIKCEDLKQM